MVRRLYSHMRVTRKLTSARAKLGLSHKLHATMYIHLSIGFIAPGFIENSGFHTSPPKYERNHRRIGFTSQFSRDQYIFQEVIKS